MTRENQRFDATVTDHYEEGGDRFLETLDGREESDLALSREDEPDGVFRKEELLSDEQRERIELQEANR